MVIFGYVNSIKKDPRVTMIPKERIKKNQFELDRDKLINNEKFN